MLTNYSIKQISHLLHLYIMMIGKHIRVNGENFAFDLFDYYKVKLSGKACLKGLPQILDNINFVEHRLSP